jgi:hypothetical protein
MKILKELIKRVVHCLKEVFSAFGQSRWGINGGIDAMMESRQKLERQQAAQRLKRQQLGIKDK